MWPAGINPGSSPSASVKYEHLADRRGSRLWWLLLGGRCWSRRHGVDAWLATIPVAPIWGTGRPTAVIVHDLRHQILPHEFTLKQRCQRALLYRLAYRQADVLIAISNRTKGDFVTRWRRHQAKMRVVPSGSRRPNGDLAPPRELAGRKVILAFGHHSNKRPELAIQGWAAVDAAAREGLTLLILGAVGKRNGELQALCDQLGLSGEAAIVMSRRLTDDEYGGLLNRAVLVVLPSTFEGFGLPVLEAFANGIPVVTSGDPALLEVAGGLAVAVDNASPAAWGAAIASALDSDERARAARRRRADTYRWEATAAAVRQCLLEVSSSVAGSSSGGV